MKKSSMLLPVFSALLSLYNGVIIACGTTLGPNPENTLWFASIYLPLALWITALLCIKLPKIGLIAYTLILIASVALAASVPSSTYAISKFTIYAQCADNLRYAFWGELFLLTNALIARIKYLS
jgi:hypothetical protein